MKNSYKDITNNLDFNSSKINKDNAGVLITASEQLIELYQNGDKRCEYKIGDRIKKKTYEYGDVHNIGHKGIIIGNLYIDDFPEEDNRESYLVQFEGQEAVCLTVKYKIELI